MQGYPSQSSLQRFALILSAIQKCLFGPSHWRSALTIRYHRPDAVAVWDAVTQAA